MDCKYLKNFRVQGYNSGSKWYQRDGHFYSTCRERQTSVSLHCVVKLCPARWTQRKNQSALAPVNPDHNHEPPTWMRERNIMYDVIKRRAAEEDMNIRLIYKEEAARYPEAAKHMPLRIILSSLCVIRKTAKQKKMDPPVDVPQVAQEIELDEDNWVDTPEPPIEEPLCPTDLTDVPKFKVQTSNFVTAIPQLQNPLYSTNSILVPVQTTSLMTTIPQLNPICPTNFTLLPQLNVQASGIITAIPQLMNPLCSTNATLVPQLKVRGSDNLVTAIPQLINPLCSTNATLVPQLKVRGSDQVTMIPQLQNPLCLTNPALDPDPDQQSEESMYQLFDEDLKPELPQRSIQYVRIAPAPASTHRNATDIPPLQDPLCSTNPALDPDPDLDHQLEEPMYQLFDEDIKPELPQRSYKFVRIAPAPASTSASSPTPASTPASAPAIPQEPENPKIRCRACFTDVPWYVFIPCGHVICRKCFKRKMFQYVCYMCQTVIERPLHMLF